MFLNYKLSLSFLSLYTVFVFYNPNLDFTQNFLLFYIFKNIILCDL